MKMELIEGFETSAIRTQTPGNYPKENILRCVIDLGVFFINIMLHYRASVILQSWLGHLHRNWKLIQTVNVT